ncbi:hypothetical protein [Nocardia sp. NPDC020380]|uniref:hypothetical protein n=1 Tax=Nocardia sp. NPDC020380 TaxID=3364309 RepID=UPI003787EE05
MTFEFERRSLPIVLRGRFRPWSIDVGHSKFLLRGFLRNRESEDLPRTFDVLFQDVSRIQVADHYDGLRVTIAEPDAMNAEARRVGGEWRDAHMFHLNSENDCDYIVAGFVFWAEVSVHASAPSPLIDETQASDSVIGKVFRL